MSESRVDRLITPTGPGPIRHPEDVLRRYCPSCGLHANETLNRAVPPCSNEEAGDCATKKFREDGETLWWGTMTFEHFLSHKVLIAFRPNGNLCFVIDVGPNYVQFPE